MNPGWWAAVSLLSLTGCDAPRQAESDLVQARGMEELHAGRWQEAAIHFQRVLQLAPDSASAHIRLGEISIRQGRRREAQDILDALPPTARQRPEARILEAEILAFAGLAVEAESLAEQVLDQHSESLEAHMLLARLYLKAAATMDLKRASAICDLIVQRFPRHREARMLLLNASLRLGRFAAALDGSRALLDLYPEDDQTYLLAGTAALWAHDPAAIPLLRQAVDLTLDRHTDRLKSLWLLKLAYDAQGAYPADLPARYRFHSSRPPPHAVDFAFVDVAALAGVDKLDRGRGSAWLDFDLDGDLDLFSVGVQTRHALYRNDGGGRFWDATADRGLADMRGGWCPSAADFDNDGDPDLFVSRDAWEGMAPNSLYRNDRGYFVDIAPEAGMADSTDSFTATWLDFDLDGKVDLYVANGVTGSGGRNSLFHNRKNSTFEDVAASAGVADSAKTIGTAAGDYDGDGWTDLYLVNIGALNRLFRNNGDGTFSDDAEEAGVLFPVEGGYVTFFFDSDNDGDLDLFAATMSAFPDVLNSMVEGRAIEPNRPFLYNNNGDGTFTDVSVPAGLGRSFGSMGIGVGDVNNDGYPDIYLANGGPQMYRLEPNVLFLNLGDGTFADVTEATGVGNMGKGHGATFADFDGDGDLDLYAGLGGHYDGDVWPNALYRNDGDHGHYLQVELVGRSVNSDAIGADVAVFSGSVLVHGQVASGFGFGSSNPLALHLGLGSVTRIDSLRVNWPGGQLQTWEGIPVDCTIRITQGLDSHEIVGR